MVLASITDTLVNFATDRIGDGGVVAVFLLVAADALGIPVAAAVIMLFAGVEVGRGDLSLGGVIAAGTLGDLVGASIAFAIGWYGRRELLEKHGAKLHMTSARLAAIDKLFARFGVAIIPVGRIVPLVRTYVSYPAGAARMSPRLFLPLTLVGALVLATVFSLIGRHIGSDWTHWRDQLKYVDYAVVVLVVAGIVYLVARRDRTQADAV